MTEHEAFNKLTYSLREAEDAINWIALHRQDQKHMWEDVATLIDRIRDQCYGFQMNMAARKDQ